MGRMQAGVWAVGGGRMWAGMGGAGRDGGCRRRQPEEAWDQQFPSDPPFLQHSSSPCTPQQQDQPRSRSVPPKPHSWTSLHSSASWLTFFSSNSPDLISAWTEGKVQVLFMKSPGREWDVLGLPDSHGRRRDEEAGGSFLLEVGGLFLLLFHITRNHSQNHTYFLYKISFFDFLLVPCGHHISPTP